MIWEGLACVKNNSTEQVQISFYPVGGQDLFSYYCRNQFRLGLDLEKWYFFKLEFVAKGQLYYHRNTTQWLSYGYSGIYILEAIPYSN